MYYYDYFYSVHLISYLNQTFQLRDLQTAPCFDQSQFIKLIYSNQLFPIYFSIILNISILSILFHSFHQTFLLHDIQTTPSIGQSQFIILIYSNQLFPFYFSIILIITICPSYFIAFIKRFHSATFRLHLPSVSLYLSYLFTLITFFNSISVLL